MQLSLGLNEEDPIAKDETPVVKDTNDQNQQGSNDKANQQADAQNDVTKDANSVFFDFDNFYST